MLHAPSRTALPIEPCTLVRPQEAAAGGAAAADYRRLRAELQRSDALATEREKGAFNPKNLEQDLARLLRDGNVEQHRDVLERPLAKSALAGGATSHQP